MQTLDSTETSGRRERWLSRGAVELLGRRVKKDLENPGYHWGFAFMIFLEIVACNYFDSSFSPGQTPVPGNFLFWGWVWISFSLFVGGMLQIGATLGEEKELGTMGLFKLTGIGPSGLYQYLMLYSSVQGIAYVVLQLPIVALIMSYCGANWQQFISVLLTLMATAFFVSSIAFFSGVSGENRAAVVGIMVAICFLWGAAILVLKMSVNLISKSGFTDPAWLRASEWFEWLGAGLLFLVPPVRLYEILKMGSSQTFAWSYLMFCLMGGSAVLFLSSRLFEKRTSQVDPQVFEIKRSFGFTVITTKKLEKTIRPCTRRSRRCWENPFVWREFQFKNGGWNRVIISGILSTLLFGFVLTSILTRALSKQAYSSSMEPGDSLLAFSATWLCLSVVGICISTLILFSAVLSSEILGKTLGTLFLVGRPVLEIIRELIRGRLMLLVHAVVPISLGLIGVVISFFLPMSFENSRHEISWTLPIQVIVVPIFLVYLGYYCCMLSIRFDLIQSEVSKWSIVFLTIFAAVILLVMYVKFLTDLSRQISQTGVLFSGLGIILVFCAATVPTISWVKRSIERAVNSRMGDE